MWEKLLQMIQAYGLETVLLALVNNLLTGLMKIPIKRAAQKLKDSAAVTRFIVFLPVILGFFLTWGYGLLFREEPIFDQTFVTQWVTSGSLSLTFYAIFEKMFPAKKSGTSDGEAEPGGTEEAGEPEGSEDEAQKGDLAEQAERKTAVKKIVLKGKRDEKAETEK